LTKETYQTDDLQERNTTLALLDMFSSIASIGATEDPLALVCKSMVRCIDAIQFAFYCYADDETGQFAAVRDGVKVYLPPPDVQRKIVARLRQKTRGGKVLVLGANDALSLLSPAQRRKWTCHQSVSVEVAVDNSPPAVLSVYLKPDFVITDRHRVWMSLFGGAAAALVSRQRAYTRAQTERDAAVKARQEGALCVESVRASVREHLMTVKKVKDGLRAGRLSLNEAQTIIAASTERLNGVLDASSGDVQPEDARHGDEFGPWVKAGLHDSRIKAFVGVRGSSKSALLHAVRSRVLASGVHESRVVIVDFENAHFRRYKTVDDMMGYLDAFPRTRGTKYLFIDEVGMVEWAAELLRRLQSRRDWNVWITTSTLHLIGASSEKKGNALDLLTYRTWVDPAVPRSHGDLERIWCQIFMRDVVSGVEHPDIRAKEALAEYYSDHLGEVKSLRDVSKGLAVSGRTISIGSVRAYRQALADANLIEFSKVYDVFEHSVVPGLSGRAFYTDLELRTWRYGSAPTEDETRLALNRLYLELRRKYDEVYTPRDRDADFVTLDANGLPVLWRLPTDSLLAPEKFRGGGG